ncbi:hypothetical protein GV791_14755 [Nocardia cyriacigeorgica]|uniref:Uncharacterized protein n=1 Tax=Nocardia cyriacigeorgica TaxID=135487 RepID=A0A6P1CUL1_9NOCA|nr:hypothetical protein [Nocardia cyriacigeorgica]NEW33815.1 hypothetical protein [Nocardia cyriacigeorgica]
MTTDSTSTPLTDEQLTQWANDADEFPAYWLGEHDGYIAAMAAELLAARAEIAALRNDLDARTSDFDAACRHLGEARARVAQLELRLEPPGSPRLEGLIKTLGVDMTDPLEILAEKVAEQRARIAELEAERDKTKRGAETLGAIVDRQCRAVLDVTGLHHLIDEDGDGDWGVVWERLAEMGAELAKARSELLLQVTARDKRITELEAWKTQLVSQGRRAVEDRDRWHRLYMPSADDTAPELSRLIDRALDDRDSARARIAELEDQVATLADAEMERASLSLYARNARRTIRTLWESRRHWQNSADELEAQAEPAGYVVGWRDGDRVELVLDESELLDLLPGPDRHAFAGLGDALGLLAEVAPEDPDTTFRVYELREVRRG